MRICYLSTGTGLGGAERQILCLAQGMIRRGHEVRITSLTPLGVVGKEAQSMGIPAATLNMRRGVPDPLAVYRLSSLLRSWQPHVVHSHMVHANLLARITRLFVNMPVLISTAHSINEGGRWREIAYRLTDSLCDTTTQVSKAGAEQYVSRRAVTTRKIRVVPNGVDTLTFSPDAAIRMRVRRELEIGDDFTWLAVGRFEEAKDYPNLLRAFAGLKRGILIVAGEGPLRKDLENTIYRFHVSDRVRFLGARNDVPDLMKAADAYVMSSAWEGMPLVLLEAAATALPIVATDVGGNHELVLNGRTGMLVSPHNSEALFQAMSHVMESPDFERRRMGELSRLHISKNHDIEKVINVWNALYHELLELKGVRLN
jgi:glycosyltransferase involved in cell wall biosynthesis